jgi:hypothetical protein
VSANLGDVAGTPNYTTRQPYPELSSTLVIVNAPTQPPIFEAQNTTEARRLVAAQARMYSDAKIVFDLRLIVVVGLAIAGGIVAIAFPSLRAVVGGGGGVALLLLSLIVGSVEQRLRIMAAMTQEEFDTRVFRLEWNSILAERPSAARIAKAASRYTGMRDSNWYEDTKATYRPYDVLICQATNLGWGASMHRLWAWILSTAGAAIAVGATVIGLNLGLTWAEMLPAIAIPALAPANEIIDQIRANFDDAHAKEETERRISDLWANGMSGKETPSENHLRIIQDKILGYRQSNAFVPDWLDSLFHTRNEAAMRQSVESRVQEARRNGLSED